MIGVLFDSYDMQANGVTVSETNIFDAPKRSVQDVRLAEADGSIIVKTTYDPKRATLDGYLLADTPSELKTLIDTFKRNMNKTNVFLDIIEEDDSTRRYLATTTNIMVSRTNGLNQAGFSVEVLIPSGVGMDTTETTLATDTVTTSTGSVVIDVQGSYKAQPVISITVDSVTGGTPDKSISIANGTTLRGITITRDWAASDIIEIDCLNNEVYVNNVITEYVGQIPSWEPGNGIISYIDDFTTRSVDISAVYTRRYL
jgi:phage-related protein